MSGLWKADSKASGNQGGGYALSLIHIWYEFVTVEEILFD